MTSEVSQKDVISAALKSKMSIEDSKGHSLHPIKLILEETAAGTAPANFGFTKRKMSQSAEIDGVQDPGLQDLKQQLVPPHAVPIQHGNDAPIAPPESPPAPAEPVQEVGDILTQAQADEIRIAQYQGVPTIQLETEPDKPVAKKVYKNRPVPITKPRWCYRWNPGGEPYPLSDFDTILLELNWRYNRNMADTEVKNFVRSNNINGYRFCPATADPYKAILVLNGSYKVNADNKTANPLYWESDEILLQRVVYMINSKPVDSDLEQRIERKKSENPEIGKSYHLNANGSEKIEFYENGGIYVDLPGGRHELRHYSPEVKWDPNEADVRHLVFAVHGIWNDQVPQSIVESAKLLNFGINNETKAGKRVVVIPIHWRTDLPEHDCPQTKLVPSLLEAILNDVIKYECKECRPKGSLEKGAGIRNPESDPGYRDPGDLGLGELDPGDLDPGDLDPGSVSRNQGSGIRNPGDLDPGDLDPVTRIRVPESRSPGSGSLNPGDLDSDP
ncbi:unnamed protein product [Caenorhabditis nigoni]